MYKYWRSQKVFSSFINKSLTMFILIIGTNSAYQLVRAIQRMCITWHIAQTLMRRRVMRRLIWVYAICTCSLFYINALTTSTQVRTLNFRQATPLAQVHSSLRLANKHVHESVFGPYIVLLLKQKQFYFAAWNDFHFADLLKVSQFNRSR